MIRWIPGDVIGIIHHSTAIDTKPLLLAFKPERGHKARICMGRFVGGLVKEFYCDGSPSACQPDFWMPVPSPWREE